MLLEEEKIYIYIMMLQKRSKHVINCIYNKCSAVKKELYRMDLIKIYKLLDTILNIC